MLSTYVERERSQHSVARQQIPSASHTQIRRFPPAMAPAPKAGALALLLLLLLACAALPATAAPPRRMLLDANATAPAAPEDANVTAPAAPEHATSSAAPTDPVAAPLLRAAAPSSNKVTDKLKHMVELYCEQRNTNCYDIDTSKVGFVDDGFTPVQLSAPVFKDAAFAALACAYSDTPYKCQIDLAIEVEQKASSTTTDGYSIDTRLG